MVGAAQLRIGDVIVVPDHDLESGSVAAPGARLMVTALDRQPEGIRIQSPAPAWWFANYGDELEVVTSGPAPEHEYGRLDPDGIVWRVITAAGDAGAYSIARGIADTLTGDPERVDVDDRADLGDLLDFVLEQLAP